MTDHVNTTNPSKFNRNGNFLHIDAEDLEYKQYWLGRYPKEVAEFAKMSLNDLDIMHRALSASIEASNGFFNSPRAKFTPAQDWLTSYIDNISGVRQALVYHAEQRDIVTKEDYRNLCSLEFDYLVLCGGEPEQFDELSTRLKAIEPKQLAKAA